MGDIVSLDPKKDYTWILTEFAVKPIKGFQTAVFDWKCKENGTELREYLRLNDNYKNTRLYGLMVQLGHKDIENKKFEPDKFFSLGLHIIAKPIKWYSDMNSETMQWKLNYDTIRPLIKQEESLPTEEEERLIMLASRQPDYSTAIQKVASLHTHWIKPFIKLCDDGKIKFAK